MVAETASRERRDPSTPPMVEGGIVTPSKANDTHKISDGAVASAPPGGGAAMRTSTLTPVFALPPGGEAPAAPEEDAKEGAANEKVAEAPCKREMTIETGGSVESAELMSVKVELALAKTK